MLCKALCCTHTNSADSSLCLQAVMGGRQVVEAAPGWSAQVQCLECAAPPMPCTNFYSKHVKVCPGRHRATPTPPQQGPGGAAAALELGQSASAACLLPSAQQADREGYQASEGQGLDIGGTLGCGAEPASPQHGALQAPWAPSCSQPADLDGAAESPGNWQGDACHSDLENGAHLHAAIATSTASQTEGSAPGPIPHKWQCRESPRTKPPQ